MTASAEKPPKPRRKRTSRRPSGVSRWDQIGGYRDIGFAVVTSIFVGSILITRIVEVLQTGTTTLTQIAPLALLTATFGLVAMWGLVSLRELGMLKQIAADDIPPVPEHGGLLVVGAGLSLALLGVASADPRIYAAIYVALKLFEFAGQRTMASMMRSGIDRIRGQGPDDALEHALQAIDTYYLRRPWHRLQLTCAALAGIALSLAVLATSGSPIATPEQLNLGAYALLIGVILLNEGVILRWRISRNRELPDMFR
jgi:hypothetical protein